MEIKEKRICGEKVMLATYGGMMRFYVNGSFNRIPDGNAGNGGKYHLIRHSDGSVEIELQTLVPWGLSDFKLSKHMDLELNRMEKVFGIEDGCLSTSSFHAGSNSDRFDYLMNEEERNVILKEPKQEK